MADDILLTTPQAAGQLGVTESSIRTAKSRNKDRLLEGSHWVTDSGRTLWTGPGIEVLQELLNCNGSVTATEPLPQCNATVTAQSPDSIGQFADAVAWATLEAQLPGQVQASINRILTNPSDLDQQRLLGILEKVGSGVTLARVGAIFAGGLQQAIAASQTSMKALGGSSDEAG